MSENTSEGLVPCPFCGCLMQGDHLADEKQEAWWAECPDCFAQGPIEESGEAAIAAWNTRQSSVPVSASVGRKALIEAVARAICEANDVDPNQEMLPGCGVLQWRVHGHEAELAVYAILALIRPVADVERWTIERCAKVARSFADRAEKGDLSNTPARNVTHMIAAALQALPPAEAENGGGR